MGDHQVTSITTTGQGRLLLVSSYRRPTRLLIAAGLASALVGCGAAEDEPPSDAASDMAAADEMVLGHVHGLGVDPADDTLYVASHYGVFRVEDGSAERVADRWQDTMGFVVVGPGHFLGSGHPDERENLPPSLGLVESTDAGETWEPVSLLGEADLHSIELVGDVIYAYDSTSQTLIVTNDGQRWHAIAQLLPILDIAVDPAVNDTVYATTSTGELVRSTQGAEPSPVYDAPSGLVAIDWQPDGPLVGVTKDGTVMTSSDGESDWTEAGRLDGAIQALDVSPGRWHAATETGVYESTDDGATWDVVLEPGE